MKKSGNKRGMFFYCKAQTILRNLFDFGHVGFFVLKYACRHSKIMVYLVHRHIILGIIKKVKVFIFYLDTI